MIRNRIKQFVDDLGITRQQFHKETGVSKTTVYALYENPERVPDNKTIALIQKRYGCRTLDLIEVIDDVCE